MAFRVGQEVVCVDDAPRKSPVPSVNWTYYGPWVKRGAVYTIRQILEDGCLYLNEVTRISFHGNPIEPPIAADRFRPIVKTDISIFTAMLAPSPKQRVDA